MTITDPVHRAVDEPGLLRRGLLRLIRDERDLPFVHLCLFFTAIVIAFLTVLYWPNLIADPVHWWVVGFAFILLRLYYLAPYILMLHNVSHRPLFRRGLGLLNHWVPTVIGPFFGETPETYYAHHVGMHHAEGNLPTDLSSTMRYDRASIFGFLTYFFRFFFLIIPELTIYMVRRRRYRMIRRMLTGELAYYIVVASLWYIDWRATLVVFVIPLLTTRFLMMAGNWGQHAFIDAKDPGSDLLSSITCINSPYNHRGFNDGYHIGHHVKATRHWTEMPQDFLDSQEQYAKEGAIVFERIDFFVVWLFLMLKRFDWLAKFYVELGDEPRSRAEIIELLQERTKPIRLVRHVNVPATQSAAGAG